jgi:cation transporter-like permease
MGKKFRHKDKKNILRYCLAAITIILLLCMFFVPDMVSAAECKQKGDTGTIDGTRTSDTYFDWECEEEGNITRIIINIFNWLAIGVGSIAVIMVIVGGIIYMTAHDSQEQAKKGITFIRNAIIALGLYMVMWTLLNWLVPGGIFSAS